MADKDIEVRLSVEGTVYDIETKPYKAKTEKGEGSSVTLQWTAKGSGVSFPASNYFEWKPNAIPPPAVPTRTTPTQLDLTYTVPGTPDGIVTWDYKICLTNGTVTVCEDPEVENRVPPPGGEEDKKDKDKDKPQR